MIFKTLCLILFLFISTNSSAFDHEKFARALGLELVDEGHPYNFLGVTHMYANDTLSRQALVIHDVKANLKETKIIKAKDYLILEIPNGENSYSSMALIGITEDEIRKNIHSSSVFKTLWNQLNLFPKAYSEDCGPEGSLVPIGLETLQNYYGTSVAKGAMKCMTNFFQGVWDSTGGLAQSAVKGIENLIQDPKKFWDQKVSEVKNLVNFIQHFDTKMKELSLALSNLPSETKTNLICSFVGGIGADVAMGILIGGAGLGKAIFSLEQYISKIVKIEKVFNLLNKVGKLKNIPSGFLERLSSSKIPNSVLDSLNIFATHQFPDFIQGAMQCAL